MNILNIIVRDIVPIQPCPVKSFWAQDYRQDQVLFIIKTKDYFTSDVRMGTDSLDSRLILNFLDLRVYS